MKISLTAIASLAAAGLSGCAVVPAYGPGAYYESEPYYSPYYSSRPIYGPPVVIVPEPIFVPRYGHRHRHDGRRGWRR